MEDTANANLQCEELTNEIDILRKIECLEKTVTELELEKKKKDEEFGVQRAKMKELFLQKEGELRKQVLDQENLKQENKRLQAEVDDLRSQLTIAAIDFQTRLEDYKKKNSDELCSLQQLLSESLEGVARHEKEVQRLEFMNRKLLVELKRFRSGSSNSHNTSGADMPQLLAVPGTVISSIARTVKSQLSNQLSSSESNVANISAPSSHSAVGSASEAENLEDDMRKAQEDAEVLRSVVVPLEEEINALKEKIREMDDELQRYKRVSATSNEKQLVQFANVTAPDTGNSSEISSQQESCEQLDGSNSHHDSNIVSDRKSEDSSVSEGDGVACPWCPVYITQLKDAQEKINDLEKHILRLERYKQELSKETVFREKMEDSWNEQKEQYKEQINTLQSKTKKAEEELKDLLSTFGNVSAEFTQELARLRDDRLRCQVELDRLQAENHDLMGKYIKHSEQLQNEPINLPNTVAELQEAALRYQEELIRAKVAVEKTEADSQEMMFEIDHLKDQNSAFHDTILKLKELCGDMYGELGASDELCESVANAGVSLEQMVINFKDLHAGVHRIMEGRTRCEDTISQLRTRISSLQTELDNSEQVQKDFVRLSQTLQVELEEIREASKEVRWEYEEDVTECRGCRSPFSTTKQKKQNCRHCGRVFCTSCLSYTVTSGPSKRQSKVCNVCHTLLVPDAAPYFSTAALSRTPS